MTGRFLPYFVLLGIAALLLIACGRAATPTPPRPTPTPYISPTPTPTPVPSITKESLERKLLVPFHDFRYVPERDAFIESIREVPFWLRDAKQRLDVQTFASRWHSYKADLLAKIDEYKRISKKVGIYDIKEIPDSNVLILAPSLDAVSKNLETLDSEVEKATKYGDPKLILQDTVSRLIGHLEAFQRLDKTYELSEYYAPARGNLPSPRNPIVAALHRYIGTTLKRYPDEFVLHFDEAGMKPLQLAGSVELILDRYMPGASLKPPSTPLDQDARLVARYNVDGFTFLLLSFADDTKLNTSASSRLQLDDTKQKISAVEFDRVFWQEAGTTYYAYALQRQNVLLFIGGFGSFWDNLSEYTMDKIKFLVGNLKQ